MVGMMMMHGLTRCAKPGQSPLFYKTREPASDPFVTLFSPSFLFPCEISI